MIVVQNRIHVTPEMEEAFAHRTGREVAEVPGRLFFALLKSDEPGAYINLSVWESREALAAWRDSEAFRQAHAGRPATGTPASRPELIVSEVVHSQGSLSSLVST